MSILEKDIKEKLPINQSNLIERYKETAKWLVNDLRNSKFLCYYYSEGVNNNEWEIP